MILSADGIVVSNYHVVGQATDVRVVLSFLEAFQRPSILACAKQLAATLVGDVVKLPHRGRLVGGPRTCHRQFLMLEANGVQRCASGHHGPEFFELGLHGGLSRHRPLLLGSERSDRAGELDLELFLAAGANPQRGLETEAEPLAHGTRIDQGPDFLSLARRRSGEP